MAQVKQFAVIGLPAAQSLSPQIHEDFARQCGIALEYRIIEPAAADFERVVADCFRSGTDGLNITLPFKERALALADQSSQRAQLAGAANTLWRDGDSIYADNTDGEGLTADLARLQLTIPGRSLLVLGAGGAARGIVPALLQQQPQLLVIANRNMARAQTLAERFAGPFAETAGDCLIATSDPSLGAGHYDLLLHATAFGKAPQTDGQTNSLPEPFLKALQTADFCYDLNYGTPPGQDTAFCAAARHLDRPTADGLGMLVQQAHAAFVLWHGLSQQRAPDADQTLRRLLGGTA